MLFVSNFQHIPLISFNIYDLNLQRCHIHSLSTGNGAITAQKRVSSEENTGFTFLGCKITGVGKAVLGRPWGPYSRVVYALTYMSGLVLPQGWNDWHDYAKHTYIIYLSIPNNIRFTKINVKMIAVDLY